MVTIPKGNFEGYIFDCDGTLAISMPVHFLAWQRVFKKHHAKFEFTWEMFRAMAGMGLHHTVEELNRQFNDNLDPIVVVADQADLVRENHHEIKPNEEVVEVARMLSQNQPVSVASGGHREHVRETLSAIHVTDIFKIVVTQDDVIRSKPAPDLFLLAAIRMAVDPCKCLVFEDSELGIQAAKRAGMQCVLVDNKY
ncbi:MAG: HAD family phosphatase [Verrucomicrobia bacterium CG_4_10_14_3_um_filter_43_23]|nr:MAG: hypothetical protein AUJ82_05795 [Verrucomicrobia bacterium CG1_02_43_26]PIP60013.1 MAG: haloacid dehalogenase [Verrucomicrobia bacterium CG22_combo_CG10-13_8_21_14_all_43_17]PIX58131.1 MAG: HAD family phosphatase [Verrucomicrobia bacterium CG_4_10_14_3_um_filter_43_23]PIY60993.1 MAG: HAD family phosphatase [Verrucomicrobia bacterium CG_4_10_14_0_8_um_filter_43_34]PJA43571.1 MAG: HAD family phosphatase [Verrucomicrobia bacterium CG_4_9_14_3_um_filter_43_20]